MLTVQAWGPRRRLINPGDCVDRIICDVRAATIVRLVMRIRHFIKVTVTDSARCVSIRFKKGTAVQL